MAASMRVRFELFVQEMGVAVAFYTGAMGFDLLREEPGYASLRRGEVIPWPGTHIEVAGRGRVLHAPHIGTSAWSRGRART